jgi:2-polyprenyl-3-methyl-5-hydroxy-6-metoxy-1,4-benzoquinol methylase
MPLGILARVVCRRSFSGTVSHVLNLAQFTKQAEPFAAVRAHSHEPAMKQLLEFAGITRGTHVIDVACGPGLVSLAAAERGATVTGVDLTPACIEAAMLAAERRNVTAKFIVSPAESLPFSNATFDVAVSRYAFHHIAKGSGIGSARAKAVAEMARVVRPGGLVVICDVLIEGSQQACAYDSLELLRDNSHAGVIEGGLRGGQELLRSAGLTALEPARYAFEAVAEDVVGASFPSSAADASEFMRRLRDAATSRGGSAVTAANSPLGVSVDACSPSRTPYAVPIGIWGGRKAL